jgi:hypothetical protein
MRAASGVEQRAMTDGEYRDLIEFLGRQFTAMDQRFDA